MSVLDLFNRKQRVIRQLRKMTPGVWSYDSAARQWNHDSGLHVYAVAAMSPRWDGDDESYVVQYRRSDNGAVVWSSGVRR